MDDPIPPQPLCSSGFIAPNFFLFVPFVQPLVPRLAGYPAYGPARMFCWMLCKSCALSPAGTIPALGPRSRIDLYIEGSLASTTGSIRSGGVSGRLSGFPIRDDGYLSFPLSFPLVYMLYRLMVLSLIVFSLSLFKLYWFGPYLVRAQPRDDDRHSRHFLNLRRLYGFTWLYKCKRK